jgi:hypothetical protein
LSESLAPAFQTSPYTPIIDAGRTPLRAVRREPREQIGEFGVPTILPRQPLHVVPLPPPARFADNYEDRLAAIGQQVAPSRGMMTSRVHENEA